MPKTIVPRPLMCTTREEQDLTLQVKEGVLPTGLSGYVFALVQVGSVNNALPIPKTLPDGSINPEFGTPLMNGDGMLYRFDFSNKGKVVLTTRLMKTPCYYADLALASGSKWNSLVGFRNFGISRMNLILGFRNQLNTAIVPTWFKNAKAPFGLMTYDVGRHYAVDTKSMELVTPIGSNKEWIPGTPPALIQPFPMVQTTAHPSFDPVTRELFSVNYTRSMLSTKHSDNMTAVLKSPLAPEAEAALQTLLEQEKNNPDSAAVVQKIHDLFADFSERLVHHTSFLAKLWKAITWPFRALLGLFKWLVTLPVISTLWKGISWPFRKISGFFQQEKAKMDSPNRVHLVRFDGENFQTWELQDQTGTSIRIDQCMHQTAITRDYVVLVDTSFKFSLDLLINNPFPHNDKIDQMLRELTAIPMLPYSTCYLVRRSDLKPGATTVPCIKMPAPIPLETVHFSAEYENPNNQITLLMVHNSAVCMSEWIRPYDNNQFTGQPSPDYLMGMFSIGDMDISRLGKYTIDGQTGIMKDQAILYEKGNTDAPEVGPNTWGIALYTFRDIISHTTPNSTIPYMWFMSNGPDPEMLTEFIYNLYDKYPNRIIPIEEVLKVTERDIDFSLNRLNTKTMKIDDHFQLGKLEYIRSLQFVPRTSALTPADPAYYTDGYIVCTLEVGVGTVEGSADYHNEIWVFDAGKISSGPVCKLTHPDMQFCFSLHSAWMDRVDSYASPYYIPVKKDYSEQIAKMQSTIEQSLFTEFFEKHVYPNFPPRP